MTYISLDEDGCPGTMMTLDFGAGAPVTVPGTGRDVGWAVVAGYATVGPLLQSVAFPVFHAAPIPCSKSAHVISFTWTDVIF
jgi:hypothetical protein